jgi:hypothetical protein
VARVQRSSAVFHRNLVSIRRLAPATGRRNSFHSFVPTGKVQSFIRETSMVAPRGR